MPEKIARPRELIFSAFTLPQAELFKPLWGKKALTNLIGQINEAGSISNFVVSKGYRTETADKIRQHLYTQAGRAAYLAEEKKQPSMSSLAQNCLALALQENE